MFNMHRLQGGYTIPAASFESDAIFREATFESDVDLANAAFARTPDLGGAQAQNTNRSQYAWPDGWELAAGDSDHGVLIPADQHR
jgi:hypothetical protein